MKNIRIASLMVVSMIALSACTLGTGPKAVGTVATQGTASTAKPVAGTAVATTTGKSALPAGGDVDMTPTPAVTVTAPVTDTTPITTSTDVTVTTGMTPTVEVTPTSTTTITSTSTDQGGAVSSDATDVKTLTTKGTLNIRSGPGTKYRAVSFVRRGVTLDVLGISADKQWWQVKCPAGITTECWIAASTRYITANK